MKETSHTLERVSKNDVGRSSNQLIARFRFPRRTARELRIPDARDREIETPLVR